MDKQPDSHALPRFDREFFESNEDCTVIGTGELGGKATGLAAAKQILDRAFPSGEFQDIRVSVPRLTVLATGVFEQFMRHNRLYDLVADDLPDDRIAHAFVKAEIPPVFAGDLRALIAGVNTPLAIRSSSLLEDALDHPFAGVYATKMVPNNQTSIDIRFRKLTEAIKFVWASTFFRDAKSYMKTIGRSIDEERMAVIIQEVVGQRVDDRFYPMVSGVIRTHNHYPTKPAKPEDGVVNLALGLGKTIVDGGISWTYSPRFPRHAPPFASTQDLLKNTQTTFWAVRMDSAPYDPVNEAEYLLQHGLDVAERDDVLRFTASTYDPRRDSLTIGTGVDGPRALNFGRILDLKDIPLNDLISSLSNHFKQELDGDVEIEFALTFDRENGTQARFGFLQVRPMMVSHDSVQVTEDDLDNPNALVASNIVLGNGENNSIVDVVYVRPDQFEAKHTPAIAQELDQLNQAIIAEKRSYLLIGFGRWGSSDPWLGIPATWPQISGARVIVEATLPDMNVDASQGSHFFHNMISFQVQYFTVHHSEGYAIDWGWLDKQDALSQTQFLRHLRLNMPLNIRVDGRNGRGVILHQ